MAAVKGTKMSRSHTVIVKDVAPYDAELAVTVASLNAVTPRTWPDFSYVGSSWVGNQGFKEQVASNIEAVIAEHVKAAIGRGEYPLARLPDGVSQAPVPQSHSPPQLNLEDFKLTLPSPNNELLLLMDTVSKGKRCNKVVLPETEMWKGMSWPDILKKHNDEFNPSGTIRPKRDAEVTVQEFLR